MFRIVQHPDGSTAIYDRLSGKLLSQTAPKRCPSPSKTNQSATQLDSGNGLTSVDSSRNRDRSPTSARNNTSSSANLTNGRNSTSALPASTVVQDESNKTQSRTLRPRNAVTEYNEDKKFESMLRAKQSARPASSSTTNQGRRNGTSSSNQQPKGPDHLVVVYRQQGDGSPSVASPSRMRLMPGDTLNKVQKTHAKDGRISGSNEPDPKKIDRETFAKYLNLIPTKEFKEKPFAELEASFPLRQNSRRVVGKRPILKYRPPQPIDDELEEFGSPPKLPCIRLVDSTEQPQTSTSDSATENKTPPTLSPIKSEPNSVVSHSKEVWLAELLAKHTPDKQVKGGLFIRAENGQLVVTPAPLNVPLKNFQAPFQRFTPPLPLSPNAKREQQMHEQRNLRRFVLKYSQKIPFSSPVGKLLAEFHPYTRLTPHAKKWAIRSNHDGLWMRSGFRHEWLDTKPSFEFTFQQLIPGAITSVRSTRHFHVTGMNMLQVSQLSKFVHTYTFTKQERLEKAKTLETGLDWRGRLLQMHCKELEIPVVSIKLCSCCKQRVCVKKGHACGKPISPSTGSEKSEKSPNTTTSSNASTNGSKEKSDQTSSSRSTSLAITPPSPTVTTLTIKTSVLEGLSNGNKYSIGSTKRSHSGHPINNNTPSSTGSIAHNVVSSTTPTLRSLRSHVGQPNSATLNHQTPTHIRQKHQHNRIQSSNGSGSSSDEDIILIGQNQAMTAPPILYRSLSQTGAGNNVVSHHQHSSPTRQQHLSHHQHPISNSHAALLSVNIQSLRQNVSKRLKSTPTNNSNGNNNNNNGRGAGVHYFDRKSQIMIEEI